jgi:hypothetical protein
MTMWNLFWTITAALVIKDTIFRIIEDVSWYFHKKKHGSILDSIMYDEENKN